MTLAQKRKAIVEEFEKKANFVDEKLTKEAISFLSDYITQALNDYTEEIKKVVKSKMIHPTPELEGADNEAIYEYNEPYQALLEELSK